VEHGCEDHQEQYRQDQGEKAGLAVAEERAQIEAELVQGKPDQRGGNQLWWSSAAPSWCR
jgi:hypothetical protein